MDTIQMTLKGKMHTKMMTELFTMLGQVFEIVDANGAIWNPVMYEEPGTKLQGIILSPGIHWHPLSGLVVVQAETNSKVWKACQQSFPQATLVDIQGQPYDFDTPTEPGPSASGTRH